MKQLWMGLQMTDKDIITNIKDLKEYLKYLLNNEIRHREKERGIGVFLAENIQRYDFQCAEILLLQRLLKKLGVKKKIKRSECPYGGIDCAWCGEDCE